MIKNAVRNTKGFNFYEVKIKLFLKEIYMKSDKEITSIVTPSSSCSSHENLFFNDLFIYLEKKKNEEQNNTLLFNKVRNDKRHRKRAFQKRGYWKKMHYFVRKNNMMCFAFKVQNIDYEKMKRLKRGEVYSS
ncbi:hypothetical protein MKS88_003273 [Plasmodium brasilianum]|uniref:Uncharacterized protein n=2 Tax=Plasmodium (Plasmodium) TaxID=418103 RepID=A0A1D3RID9_PLAMA|nr:conserved Plasmodium protein, unknown function [Plasmodium malariae]KAI4837854.1 hypothetical protein MKS88_003273 [Plasmodium brasilianum]SCN44952.1 conserved Plasmodium protein, unknown function [Plasmodium malariae]